MPSDRAAMLTELKQLQSRGYLLRLAMADDLGPLPDEVLAKTEFKRGDIPAFGEAYESWYSVSLRLIAQVLPDRLEDFRAQYKNDKRKEIDFLTYTISDYLIGLRTTRGGKEIVGPSAAYPKLERQLQMVDAAASGLESKLLDITEVLQADLFDSELDAASGLNKGGFVRAGGAVAGVVLERHLAHVAGFRGLKTRKKAPTINDLNQMLKDADSIDTAMWRFIQHLGDLRNICDHAKDREPTRDDVSELVEGVRKVTKSVF